MLHRLEAIQHGREHIPEAFPAVSPFCTMSYETDAIYSKQKITMPGPQDNPLVVASHHRKEFGVFLKDKRQGLGYSQATLAGKVGCDPKTISNIETGKSAVTVEILDAVLEVLKTNYAELKHFSESDIEIGSKEFRVRTYILRGLLQGRLLARDQDVRVALTRYDDEDYRREKLSADELDRVLQGLVCDGFLEESSDGKLLYRIRLSYTDNYLLGRYAKHIASLLMQNLGFHDGKRGVARQADRIVSARDATENPESFYLTLEAAQIALASEDPFAVHLTLGYHRAFKQMHGWCLAAVAPERKKAFHEEFASRTIRFLQKSTRAYSIPLRGDTHEKIQAIWKEVDSSESNFCRGITDLKEEYFPVTTGLDYSQPDWTGGAFFS